MFAATAALALVAAGHSSFRPVVVPTAGPALGPHVVLASSAAAPDASATQLGAALSLREAVAEAARRQAVEPRAGGAAVRLQPGTYELSETLRFVSSLPALSSPSSPFTPDAPLVIESENVEDVAVLSGGVQLTEWSSDPQAGLWVAHMPVGAFAANVTSLWVGGVRRSVARTATVQYASKTTTSITLAAGTLPAALSAAPGLRAIVFHCWTASYHDVSSVSPDGLTVTLRNAINPAFDGSAATGHRVCVPPRRLFTVVVASMDSCRVCVAACVHRVSWTKRGWVGGRKSCTLHAKGECVPVSMPTTCVHLRRCDAGDVPAIVLMVVCRACH